MLIKLHNIKKKHIIVSIKRVQNLCFIYYCTEVQDVQNVNSLL